MAAIKFWGFDGSAYVRTVKMLLAAPGFADWWRRTEALPSYKATVPHLG